jgi:endo-1,4-beta-xylanase
MHLTAGPPRRLNAAMTRRTFLKTTMVAAASAPRLFAGPNSPDSPEARLLEEAEERIRRHRRRGRTLALQDASGRPLAGVRVRVEQVRHEFLFGCNLFQFGRGADSDLEDAYRRRFAELFNFATLGFYWAFYEPRRGEPRYADTERVLEWTRAQGIVCKGHPLVWDHPAGSPRWLPEDDVELARLCEARVREIVSRFRGRIEMWDVVNEATHLPDRVNQTRMARWGLALGPVPYTRRPLEVAREAHPAATLLVNDYRLDPRYYDLLDALRDADGRPLFDAVGLQSHMHGGVWPLRRVWEVCDRYAKLGRPLHFTETTVLSGPRLGPGENWGTTTAEGELQQADYVVRFYTMVFAHPATQALTWWDLSDRGAWQRAPAGLLRRDMSPKPAYERLQELIRRRWWTRGEQRTDESGLCRWEAFHGIYRVTIEREGSAPVVREVDWRSAAPDRTVLTV